MKTVEINTASAYNVLIGAGLLEQLGEQTAKLVTGRKIAIISDTNVWPIYGRAALESLESAGFNVVFYAFPAGEESKSGDNYLEILNFLAENELTRSDCIVALGGGVVGDLAGFVAASYLRGIDYIQVPTSLLAMVDSSVGGKTAIDLPAGKNLCGAFYQPKLVLCDTAALNTLPGEVFRDGCAEVIKYGILFDPALFDELLTNGLHFDREQIVARCVELKRDTVTHDEFDRGVRMLLNLGHTVGHGIERCSDYTVTHGQAVAIGTAIVARASGIRDTYKILACLERFGLPVSTTYSAEMLADCALMDKKRSGGIVNLIIPNAIGDCRIVPTPIEHLKSFIEKGL